MDLRPEPGCGGPKLIRSRRGPFTYMREDRTAADLIVAIDEQKIANAEDFLSYIEGKRPGDDVTLTIIRDGRKTSVALTLASTDAPERPE